MADDSVVEGGENTVNQETGDALSYTLDSLLPIENQVTFFLGNSGSGKTTGFTRCILPYLRCEGEIFIKTEDRSDFEEVSSSSSCPPIRFLSPSFNLTEGELEDIPPGSILFYGEPIN